MSYIYKSLNYKYFMSIMNLLKKNVLIKDFLDYLIVAKHEYRSLKLDPIISIFKKTDLISSKFESKYSKYTFQNKDNIIEIVYGVNKGFKGLEYVISNKKDKIESISKRIFMKNVNIKKVKNEIKKSIVDFSYLKKVKFLEPFKEYLLENRFEKLQKRENESIYLMFKKDDTVITFEYGKIYPEIEIGEFDFNSKHKNGLRFKLYSTKNDRFSKYKFNDDVDFEELDVALKRSIYLNKVNSKLSIEDKVNIIDNTINPFTNSSFRFNEKIIIFDKDSIKIAKKLKNKRETNSKLSIVNLYKFQIKNPNKTKNLNKLQNFNNFESFSKKFNFNNF